jgi:hypothetical protein
MIPERALDEGEAAKVENEKAAGRKIIPFSVKVNRISLAVVFSVLLLLGAGMAWSQAGMGDRFAAPTPEMRGASLTINTPTPAREAAPKLTLTVRPTVEVALSGPTRERAETSALTPTKEVTTNTEVMSRTRQVVMKVLTTPASGEVATTFGSGAADQLPALSEESDAEDGSLPSTGISLWLPIQGMALMALLFFWRELRWHRTGR